jgi:hypothetical protein
MKKIAALLVISNLVWFANYLKLDIERDGYRDQIIKAEDAIKSLPDRQKYFLGQEQNGDLIVTCVNGGDPTIRGSKSYTLIDITCGGDKQ